MKIKVILEDGLVRGILKDSGAAVHVEVIDTSNCYEDHKKLEEYAQKLFKDPSFKECDYSVADFTGKDVPEKITKGDDAMIQFNVNNQRKIQLTQTEPDGAVTVTTWEAERNGVREVESEYQISPGDFVMMLNWYRYQKENGNPDLNF